MVIRDELKDLWLDWTSPSFQATCKPFEIEVRIGGILAGNDPTNLDSLLAAIVAECKGLRCWDEREVYAMPVPLKMAWQNKEGVPLWYANPFEPAHAHANSIQSIVIVKPLISNRFIVKKNFSIATVMKNGKPKSKKIWQLPISMKKGVHKAQMKPIPAQTAQIFKATGIGNIQEIVKIMDHVQFMGKGKRAIVLEYKIREVDSFDFKRPIPIEYVDRGGQREKIGFTPPYFKKKLHTLCA